MANSDETSPSDETEDNRERVAWGVFALLVALLGAQFVVPAFAPNPAIIGALGTIIVTLLVTRN